MRNDATTKYGIPSPYQPLVLFKHVRFVQANTREEMVKALKTLLREFDSPPLAPCGKDWCEANDPDGKRICVDCIPRENSKSG